MTKEFVDKAIALEDHGERVKEEKREVNRARLEDPHASPKVIRPSDRINSALDRCARSCV